MGGSGVRGGLLAFPAGRPGRGFPGRLFRIRRAELLDPVGAQHEPSPQEDQGQAERGEHQGEGEAIDEEREHHERAPPAPYPFETQEAEAHHDGSDQQIRARKGHQVGMGDTVDLLGHLLGRVIGGQVDDDDGPDDGGDAQPGL